MFGQSHPGSGIAQIGVFLPPNSFDRCWMGGLRVTEGRSLQHQLGPTTAEVKDQSYSNLAGPLSWTLKAFHILGTLHRHGPERWPGRACTCLRSAFQLLWLLASLENEVLPQDLFWHLHNQHWGGHRKPCQNRAGVCCWLLYFLSHGSMVQENWLVQC